MEQYLKNDVLALPQAPSLNQEVKDDYRHLESNFRHLINESLHTHNYSNLKNPNNKGAPSKEFLEQRFRFSVIPRPMICSKHGGRNLQVGSSELILFIGGDFPTRHYEEGYKLNKKPYDYRFLVGNCVGTTKLAENLSYSFEKVKPTLSLALAIGDYSFFTDIVAGIADEHIGVQKALAQDNEYAIMEQTEMIRSACFKKLNDTAKKQSKGLVRKLQEA